MLNSINLLPMGADFDADRRADVTKIIVTFLNFANEPNSGTPPPPRLVCQRG